MQLVLFNPSIGLFQVLPVQAWVDQGAMVMKGYSAFPKALGVGGSYPSAEVQSVYSTAQADWGNFILVIPGENDF